MCDKRKLGHELSCSSISMWVQGHRNAILRLCFVAVVYWVGALIFFTGLQKYAAPAKSGASVCGKDITIRRLTADTLVSFTWFSPVSDSCTIRIVSGDLNPSTPCGQWLGYGASASESDPNQLSLKPSVPLAWFFETFYNNLKQKINLYSNSSVHDTPRSSYLAG